MAALALWLAAAACSSHDDPQDGELCNGIDDNGDGRIDEGCPCTASTTKTFGGGPSYPTALDALGGQSVVAWWVHVSPGAGDASLIGTMPDAAGGFTDGPGRSRVTPTYAAASAGSEILLVGAPSSPIQIFTGDATSGLALPADARAIAWTGDHYEIAAVGAAGSVYEVRLALDHTVTSTTLMSSPQPGQLLDATVAADASHALLGRFYAVDGVNHQVLTQVCL